jgi:hypothetical protein
MQDKAMRKIPTHTLKYFVIPAFLLVAGVCGFFASEYVFTKAGQKYTAPLLSATDLPAGSTMRATLENSGRVSDLTADNDVIDMPSAPLLSPYRLSASIKLPKEQYRDVRFTVTHDTLSVVTDGFHAGDLVFLDINGRNAFGRIPSDWSGKIELSTPLPQDRNVNACVRVAGQTESFGLCHGLPERQVL